MNKITLNIDCTNFINNELGKYLNTLNGVLFVKIDTDKNEIYVEYDSSTIPIKVLIMEIMSYLNLQGIPSIIGFDKHNECNIKKEVLIIDDLCCEYCLKGKLEDLLDYDEVNSAYTDFNYVDKKKVNIFITYNDKVLKLEELNQIINS